VAVPRGFEGLRDLVPDAAAEAAAGYHFERRPFLEE